MVSAMGPQAGRMLLWMSSHISSFESWLTAAVEGSSPKRLFAIAGSAALNVVLPGEKGLKKTGRSYPVPNLPRPTDG
jgi:hypothetical protein